MKCNPDCCHCNQLKTKLDWIQTQLDKRTRNLDAEGWSICDQNFILKFCDKLKDLLSL